MTARLYYDDPYLTTFHARVVEYDSSRRSVYLDSTAFYPDSGGQPADHGTLNGIAVEQVVDEENRVAHVIPEPLGGPEVEGRIDWPRRFDHMQQHSGQHLLSAVLEELFGMKTLSFHLGTDSSTIDLAIPGLSAAQIKSAETRANALVFENRRLQVTYEEAGAVAGLRKASERSGTLRVVSIDGIDRSACGGTHVRATGEIGPILIRRMDKIRGNVRLEFLCGGRAFRRARADYEAMVKVAQSFSCALDDAPEMVLAQQEKLTGSEKARRKLASELAVRRGRDEYFSAAPGENGMRFSEAAVPAIDDEQREESQGFTSGAKAVRLAYSREPATILLAASADSGVHAGNILKQALVEVGGRGGGSSTVAQGGVPDGARLDSVLARLRAAVNDLANTAAQSKP